MEDLNKHIITVKGFLTPDECANFIARSEKLGYEKAKVQISDSKSDYRPEIRNNQRVLIEDQSLARSLFERAKNELVRSIGLYTLFELNELFRFYKYEVGQEFKMHQDGSFERNDSECSFYTFLIYLNDNFVGGETEFQNGTVITPGKGDLLVFYHPLPHQGNPILKGTKYVLRTDVMYKQQR